MVEPKGLDEQFDEEFEFDGSDVDEDGGFPVASEGRHPAIVIDIFMDESQEGNDMYVWDFLIIGGEDEGIEVRDWTSLLPTARWRVADYLRACGIDAYGKVVNFKKSDVVGSPVYIEVEHRERDGKTRDDVEDIYEPDEDLKELAESYKEGGQDDDVPF